MSMASRGSQRTSGQVPSDPQSRESEVYTSSPGPIIPTRRQECRRGPKGESKAARPGGGGVQGDGGSQPWLCTGHLGDSRKPRRTHYPRRPRVAPTLSPGVFKSSLGNADMWPLGEPLKSKPRL